MVAIPILTHDNISTTVEHQLVGWTDEPQGRGTVHRCRSSARVDSNSEDCTEMSGAHQRRDEIGAYVLHRYAGHSISSLPCLEEP